MPVDLFTGALTGAGFNTTSNMSAASFAAGYGKELPALAAQGDFFALVVLFNLGFICLVIVNKLTGAVLLIVRHAIVLIITGFGAVLFYRTFQARAALGMTFGTMVFGTFGTALCIVGLVYSVYSLVTRVRQSLRRMKASALGAPAETRESLLSSKRMNDAPDELSFKEMFGKSALKGEKSLLSVLAFVVVAQFGVFSSMTIAAPNVKTGMMLLAFFLVAAFLFIRQGYRSYRTGLMHLGFTLAIGFALSVTLGAAWNEVALRELLSLAYFRSESLIALISGMALSLFAGSRS